MKINRTSYSIPIKCNNLTFGYDEENLLYKNLKYFKEQHFKYSNDELKFLKFIDYYSDILDTRCVLCDSDTSASFNTPEELEDIRQLAYIKQVTSR